METKTTQQATPTIMLARSDYERISNLAAAVSARIPDGCEALFSELERAVLVADGSIAPDVVRMGSIVTYRTDAGEARTVALVFPGDADISQDKISVLTPVGTALLGLSAGQSISWSGRNGRAHWLPFVNVAQDPAGDSSAAGAGPRL